MALDVPRHLPDGTWYVPEQTVKIIAFYEQGWSASLIGERMGMSKGMVCGRLDRLKRMGYPFTIDPNKRNSRPGPRKRVLGPKPFKPGSLPKHEPDEVSAKKQLLITDIKDGFCKYAVSKTTPWYFCGRPTPDGMPWCPKHYHHIYKKEYGA